MKLYVIAANDPLTAVEFNGQSPPMKWTPKVNARLVRIDYRPGQGAIIHVVTDRVFDPMFESRFTSRPFYRTSTPDDTDAHSAFGNARWNRGEVDESAPRHDPTDVYDPDYGQETTAMPCAKFPPETDAYSDCWRLSLFPS